MTVMHQIAIGQLAAKNSFMVNLHNNHIGAPSVCFLYFSIQYKYKGASKICDNGGILSDNQI